MSKCMVCVGHCQSWLELFLSVSIFTFLNVEGVLGFLRCRFFEFSNSQGEREGNLEGKNVDFEEKLMFIHFPI